MQTIIGMLPHIMVIGMPQDIMRFMLSQHIFGMSMVIMPVGFIMQTMPMESIRQSIDGIIGMPQQDIIGMPAQVMVQGVPLDIIDIIMSQQSFTISMVTPSAGFITHIMPSAVMEQSMWHIIGIMVAIGMAGMPIIGMLFIMSATPSARVLDFDEYRRRQALRDCGTGSRRRQFLWVSPFDGRAWVGVFRPAGASAIDALRMHDGRAG